MCMFELKRSKGISISAHPLKSQGPRGAFIDILPHLSYVWLLSSILSHFVVSLEFVFTILRSPCMFHLPMFTTFFCWLFSLCPPSFFPRSSAQQFFSGWHMLGFYFLNVSLFGLVCVWSWVGVWNQGWAAFPHFVRVVPPPSQSSGFWFSIIEVCCQSNSFSFDVNPFLLNLRILCLCLSSILEDHGLSFEIY